MNRIGYHSRLFLTAAAMLFFCACAPSTQTTMSDGASSADRSPFRNILVIGVAPDYEGRTQFERKVAKDLSAAGTTATPMYVAAGGNTPIDRDAIEKLVSANDYDAVLISRVVDRDASTTTSSGSTSTKAVRRNDRPLDLFRYDYEELNEPAVVNFDLAVKMHTELFDTDSSTRVWELDISISDKEHLSQLINEASEKILRQLKKDKLIGG